MIDWVYDVDRAARIADFIYYISPVKGVAEAIKALDPEAATNPLLFPPAGRRRQAAPAADLGRGDGRDDERAVRRPERRLTADASRRRRSRDPRDVTAPPLARPLPAPAARASCGCALFFVLPNIQMFLMSLSTEGVGQRAHPAVRVHLGLEQLHRAR